MENPIKIDDLRVPPCWETSICLFTWKLVGIIVVPFPPSRNKKILVGSCHWVSSVPSPFTSETERRKEQNRNMEDMDFGCGEPCCGEPYLGFGRRMAVSRLLGCICCRASKGRVVA